MSEHVDPYVIPSKKINCQRDLEKFLKSSTFQDIWNFILALNEAVRDKKTTAAVPQSSVVQSLVEQLNRLSDWIDDIPPIEQPMRFGNAAFRTWHKRLVENSRNLLEQVLPPQLHPSIVELAPYLEDSFGNSQRIDYGSGHEATFLAFMLCLKKIGASSESDAAALVFQVFGTYLKVTRKLQTVYKLEPAGSHGVWGLDDYAFLPFLWGSSQLYSHPEITPRSVLNDQVVELYKDDYLYIGAIHFIKQVKSGPFAEHSPYLYDISCITGGWPKANQGLLKMYQAEVWNKFPVIQHFLFGSLLPFD
ncbi:Serine/threonine-protein phosphatase 2A activator [Galdieria sulphuraria]|uniref:Serine/threonine-protein phosphatase 2A activator n=1 Tax=Galdieria sulphuraria TaxID=130081 RepID=M2W164_GALSU|nr:peptidylprolyl isomerase [Galdieria sulphuraria]EME29371.1 peptidylprolyl isomerase [Galdieria sulphuraria]GJD05843.1 Serine/threonine-protein phosphatase 2A activator [Galdieria sulphuraria]|eukprot:XP_005705891.1 peptidylprolyl isomerase [Galdieria sulphuraria]